VHTRGIELNIGKILRFLVATSAVASLLPEPAHAITCRVRTNPVNFGVYVPLSTAPLDVTGQIVVRCQAQPGTFEVIIGPGTSGDQLARALSAGGGLVLYYNLYRDAARTQIWGDGSPPTFTVTGSRIRRGRPTFYTYPIFGRVFANQAPDPGIYADNLVVTVLF
jgi:spore coat protein U-like protein